ncbi:hypothetical protein BDQ17DRAFT_1327296 [Cyathus striatus]|nr:hypothetical protein BDQ17DRAFT_1327296 [Cyathus striatus]
MGEVKTERGTRCKGRARGGGNGVKRRRWVGREDAKGVGEENVKGRGEELWKEAVTTTDGNDRGRKCKGKERQDEGTRNRDGTKGEDKSVYKKNCKESRDLSYEPLDVFEVPARSHSEGQRWSSVRNDILKRQEFDQTVYRRDTPHQSSLESVVLPEAGEEIEKPGPYTLSAGPFAFSHPLSVRRHHAPMLVNNAVTLSNGPRDVRVV